jgi:hypothetical protein
MSRSNVTKLFTKVIYCNSMVLPSNRVTRRFGKNSPKVAQTISKQTKYQKLIIPAKTWFERAYLSENVIYLQNQKVAQNVAIYLGYFNFSKIIMSFKELPNWLNITQSGHPSVNLSYKTILLPWLS